MMFNQRGISKLNLGYNAKMEVYTNSSSDIPVIRNRTSADRFKMGTISQEGNERRGGRNKGADKRR
jgi:hypothetical protein